MAFTMKFEPVIALPAAVTITSPVVAPLGTSTTMLFALQLMGIAVVPLKVTVLLLAWLDPKPLPVIVTAVPTDPVVGLKPVIVRDEEDLKQLDNATASTIVKSSINKVRRGVGVKLFL
jgi:hypothetical protein